MPRISRLLSRLVGVVAVSTLLGGAAAALDADDVDPARVLTVEEAEAEYQQALVDEAALTTEVARIEDAREQLLAAQSEGATDEQAFRLELEEARREARQLAVGAYVSGGSLAELDYVFGSDNSSELTWRAELARDQAARAELAARHYQALVDATSEELIDQVLEVDRLTADLETVTENLFFAGVRVKATEQMVTTAEAHERASDAVESATYGAAPDDDWARLRFCESSDNYQAISRSGRYRGAYQFDQATWESVGGTGDPAAAPPGEQDARARELYARRGNAPWPICGRHLP